jgi:transcriptional regulator GlxA family with amidase domain
MLQNGKAFWLAEAASYVAECREKASCVRASEFANRVNHTPVQLARVFHATVGLRVKNYLHMLQIEHAKELLRTTPYGTVHIATECGFGTARSFYRAFRRSTGISPTDYRKEMSLAQPDIQY